MVGGALEFERKDRLFNNCIGVLLRGRLERTGEGTSECCGGPVPVAMGVERVGPV